MNSISCHIPVNLTLQSKDKAFGLQADVVGPAALNVELKVERRLKPRTHRNRGSALRCSRH
jgi:hypothetical protein